MFHTDDNRMGKEGLMPDTSGVSPAAKQCYVVASNSFIAEDAAQVLRESLPECDVQLFDHPDSAASALQLTDEHVHVWMIGPRWDLARHTLAALVGARDGLMVILSAEPLEDGDQLACRTLWGELPFTQASLGALIAEVWGLR